MTEHSDAYAKMPLLFLGHGSPMNAIEENVFVVGFRDIAKTLPAPKAILCISAHWETDGTFVTAMEKPKTIHDFGGFPEELYKVIYPAPGSPQLAGEIKALAQNDPIQLDHSWGLDHGTWSVVKHLYPKADVPVVQLSLNVRFGPQQHYDLAKELSALRSRGILIIGSGNIVHNLGRVNFANPSAPPEDWASDFDEKVKAKIISRDHEALINYLDFGRSAQISVPTNDHYLPLLYTLGLQSEKENSSFLYEGFQYGNISMRCVRIG
jgi:4,5-DOPA dioxygenase extradiol